MENITSPDGLLPTEKQKAEFTYYYYLAYYPSRYKVTEEYKQRRQFIWEFKNGKHSMEVADTFVEDLEYFRLSHPISNWWLCIIPASSENTTENRFMRFCEILCSKTDLNNGYSLITNRYDRPPKHRQGEEERNAVDILETIDFNDVRGKKILLFDDIYTTGKSFLKVARKLKALGAIEVKGIFLGKTHWLEDEEQYGLS